MATYHLSTPLKEEDMRKLDVGDVVYISGTIFTARDMAHLKIRGLLEQGQPLPKDFNGAAVFHAGPVCLKNDDGSWRLNVIGPTTSIRMEPYADMVGKLGTMAGEAFDSNTELVAFAEQINKQFALAGTSGQGMQAAMLQLTQAMSSGTLRGEELNSILEQAPTITKTIADYLGKTTGEMREMAADGEITAPVVKNAMFAAADETNAAAIRKMIPYK